MNCLQVTLLLNFGDLCPQTLKTTYVTLIRPVMEYPSAIWFHSSTSALKKIDNTQVTASKIIIGAASSTNNIKSQQECKLQLLDNRRKRSVITFTNNIRSPEEEHIGKQIFLKWKKSTRLKRSSTMLYDLMVRQQTGLEHYAYDILEEPALPLTLPENIKRV